MLTKEANLIFRNFKININRLQPNLYFELSTHLHLNITYELVSNIHHLK